MKHWNNAEIMLGTVVGCCPRIKGEKSTIGGCVRDWIQEVVYYKIHSSPLQFLHVKFEPPLPRESFQSFQLRARNILVLYFISHRAQWPPRAKEFNIFQIFAKFSGADGLTWNCFPSPPLIIWKQHILTIFRGPLQQHHTVSTHYCTLKSFRFAL